MLQERDIIPQTCLLSDLCGYVILVSTFLVLSLIEGLGAWSHDFIVVLCILSASADTTLLQPCRKSERGRSVWVRAITHNALFSELVLQSIGKDLWGGGLFTCCCIIFLPGGIKPTYIRACVCSSHYTVVLLIDIQHNQCPCRFIILESYKLCGHKLRHRDNIDPTTNPDPDPDPKTDPKLRHFRIEREKFADHSERGRRFRSADSGYPIIKMKPSPKGHS